MEDARAELTAEARTGHMTVRLRRALTASLFSSGGGRTPASSTRARIRTSPNSDFNVHSAFDVELGPDLSRTTRSRCRRPYDVGLQNSRGGCGRWRQALWSECSGLVDRHVGLHPTTRLAAALLVPPMLGDEHRAQGRCCHPPLGIAGQACRLTKVGRRGAGSELRASDAWRGGQRSPRHRHRPGWVRLTSTFRTAASAPACRIPPLHPAKTAV